VKEIKKGVGMERREQAMAEQYDEMAERTGWKGPDVVFSLASPYLVPGKTILDIGIGTGLCSKPFRDHGMRVIGLDISNEMLESCRKKGVANEFVCHDLEKIPYPFEDASCDMVISSGVFQFFKVLDTVFGEVHRVLIEAGLFIFITGDRFPDDKAEVVVDPDPAAADDPVIMYRHSDEQVTCWLEKNGFILVKTEVFLVFMDVNRRKSFPVRAYLAQKSRSG
jgi:predicted TPR repeat methyltransferase